MLKKLAAPEHRGLRHGPCEDVDVLRRLQPAPGVLLRARRRLVGHQLTVRVYHESLELCPRHQGVVCCNCRAGAFRRTWCNVHVIDYSFVNHSLRRKPMVVRNLVYSRQPVVAPWNTGARLTRSWKPGANATPAAIPSPEATRWIRKASAKIELAPVPSKPACRLTR